MSSNAVEIKHALKALIHSLPDFQDVQVTYGVPNTFDKRWFNIGRITWDSSEWVTNRSREESFSIEVGVSVVQSAGSAESTELEAMRLAGVIEDAIKAAPSFGNPRVVTSGFKPARLNSFPNDPEGFEAQYECAISVTARL